MIQIQDFKENIKQANITLFEIDRLIHNRLSRHELIKIRAGWIESYIVASACNRLIACVCAAVAMYATVSTLALKHTFEAHLIKCGLCGLLVGTPQ